MLEQAMEIAKNALAGITDQNGEPYFNHSLRVMEKMDTLEEKTVAIMHDVMEDTHYKMPELEAADCFSRKVLEALEQLTKHKNMTYFEYIEDICSRELASKVKLAEVEDNMDIFRVNKMSFKTYSLEDRAERVKKLLRER